MTCWRASADTKYSGTLDGWAIGSSSCHTQLRQRAEEIAIVDDDLVRLGADRARDLARVLELVERAVLEGHREGLQRPVDHPRHQRGDRAAVDAAGQEHAERHVAHQPEADRFLEQRAESRDDRAEG